MLKLNYTNVCVNKFHQELINADIAPNAVTTLQDCSCELQFHNVFEYQITDEEGNVTGQYYKERITVIIDEGLETEHTEEQYIDFDYDSLIEKIKCVLDCHDPTPLPVPLTIEERIAQMDADIQINYELNLEALGVC